MPAEYFYNGHLRWSVYWENPNFMACFFSCVLVWLWWVELLWTRSKRRDARIVTLVLLHGLELCCWFVIAKTYSRGGMLAALCALLCFFAVARQDGWHPFWRRGLNVLVRAGLVFLICVITGFAGRVSPGHLAQDMSVSNRLELWRGGLAMIWDSPFAGWGFKQGGMAYVNWYQAIERTVKPTGFVNSYLELAVNHGIFALFLSLSVLMAAVLIAFRMRKRSWCVAAGSCVVAWMVGNVWTCCWYEWSLWVLPCASMFLLFIAGARNKVALVSCIHSAGLALFAVAVLLGSGYAAAQNTCWKVKPLAGADVVMLSKRDSSETPDKADGLWVDGAIFGAYYGKAIRASCPGVASKALVVYAPWYRSGQRAGLRHDICIFSGFHADRIQSGERGLQKTIIFYPSVYPPEKSLPANHGMMLCLPLADTSQYDRVWRIWAKRTGVKLIHLSQGGRLISTSNKTAFWSTILEQ